MCVNDVCEVKVTGRVLGFVRDAEIKKADPHGQLLVYAFVLQGKVIWLLSGVRQGVLQIYAGE